MRRGDRTAARDAMHRAFCGVVVRMVARIIMAVTNMQRDKIVTLLVKREPHGGGRERWSC